jgi:hypothetical protein
MLASNVWLSVVLKDYQPKVLTTTAKMITAKATTITSFNATNATTNFDIANTTFAFLSSLP